MSFDIKKDLANRIQAPINVVLSVTKISPFLAKFQKSFQGLSGIWLNVRPTLANFHFRIMGQILIKISVHLVTLVVYDHAFFLSDICKPFRISVKCIALAFLKRMGYLSPLFLYFRHLIKLTLVRDYRWMAIKYNSRDVIYALKGFIRLSTDWKLPIFFLMGQSRPFFLFIFVFSTCYNLNSNLHWKKRRWCAWDSNPESCLSYYRKMFIR